jgi:hypothetical protein
VPKVMAVRNDIMRDTDGILLLHLISAMALSNAGTATRAFRRCVEPSG